MPTRCLARWDPSSSQVRGLTTAQIRARKVIAEHQAVTSRNQDELFNQRYG